MPMGVGEKTNILDSLNIKEALKLAKRKAKEGQFTESINICNNILERYPLNKDCRVFIKTLPSQEKPQLTGRQDPSSSELSSLIGFYKEGKFQSALEVVQRLQKVYTCSVVLNDLGGEFASELGFLDTAIEYFSKSLEINPSAGMTFYSLANALKRKGNYRSAISNFQQSIEIQPGHVESHFNLANTFKELGDLESAIKHYQRAMEINPSFAGISNNMGSVYARMGQIDLAIDTYSAGLDLRLNDANLYNNRGVLFHKKKNYDQAINDFNAAIKLNEGLADAFNNLGSCYREIGEYDKALDNYKRAIELNSDFPDAHNNVGVVLKHQGNTDAALKHFSTAIKYNSGFSDAYNNLATIHVDRGELNDALSFYQKAIKNESRSANTYSNLGLLLIKKGELIDAINCFKLAIEIDSEDARSWVNLIPLLRTCESNAELETHLEFLPFKDESQGHVNAKISMLRLAAKLGTESAIDDLKAALESFGALDHSVLKSPGADEKVIKGPCTGEKLVALVHFGRSGTGFLHSLIDGHPEVSTLPGIYLSEYFDHATWKQLTAGGWDGIVDRCLDLYRILFDASDAMPVLTKHKSYLYELGRTEGLTCVGDQQDEVLSIDKNLFRNELKRLMSEYSELNSLSFFQLMFQAYNSVIGDKNKKSLIFYHIHNPSLLAQLNFLSLAPSAQWITMVREPLQSLESWVCISFNENKCYEIADRILSMLLQISDVSYPRKNTVGVRLEDLKRRPKETIPALCRWMGIKEHETLYEMTAQGKRWWGDPNSPDYKKDGMEPFGTSAIDREVGAVFSDSDQFILRTLFYPFSLRFGYAEENDNQFKIDLQKVRPLLDNLFDFEKEIVERTKVVKENFIKSGSYVCLRSVLVERWDVLNTYGTYPNMLEPLLTSED